MTKTKFEAMEILNKDAIPCGPMLSMKEIAGDEGLRASGMLVDVEHPQRGRYMTVGMPIKMSDSPAAIAPSPLLGQHNDEVLSEVGYSADEIAALRRERII